MRSTDQFLATKQFYKLCMQSVKLKFYLPLKGRVAAYVYKQYFQAGGGWGLIFMTVSSILMAQVVTSFSDLWLTYWYVLHFIYTCITLYKKLQKNKTLI